MKTYSKQNQFLAQRFLQEHPEHCARLVESAADQEIVDFIAELSDDAVSKLFAALSPLTVARLLPEVKQETIIGALATLPVGQLAQVLRVTDTPLQEALLSEMPAKVVDAVQAVLRFPPSAVGQYVNPEILTLAPEFTVSEAIKQIQKDPRPVQQYLYVVDNTQELKGICSVKRLLLQKPSGLPLSNVMETNIETVRADEVVESSLASAAWRKWPILPVVDKKRRFIGIVSYESLVRHVATTSRNAHPLLFISASRAMGEVFWQALKVASTVMPHPPNQSADRKGS